MLRLILPSIALWLWSFAGTAPGSSFEFQGCEPQWTQSGASGPSARSGHAMTYDAHRQVTLLFGGSGNLDQTWQWDGQNWSQIQVPGPSGRNHPAMAFDSDRNVVVLFGGHDGSDLQDTWEWDGSSWTQKSTTGPPRRRRAQMVYDPERQRSFLFGGYQGSTALGDSWEWDGQNWVQRPVSGPQARGGHAMTYDSHRGQALLFGGSGASGSFFGDTWTWDGQVWNLAANSGPSARELVGLAFDSVQGYAVLFGGKYGPYYDDSWKWDGSQWLSMNATGPPARFAGDMVFDQARSEFVLYGGWNGNNLGDTWKLGGDTSVIIQQHPQDAWAPSGGAASFSVVTQLGVGTVQYQWRRNGQPLSDGGTLSGSQTSILQFSQAYPGDAGTYDVEITDACQTLISETAELRVGGPILQLTTSCPNGGPASLSWTGATPHGAIAVLFALQAGNFTVPGGYACAGTQLGLGAPGLQVVHQASSDAQGEGTAQGSAGPNLCGRFFQLIDLQTCAVSNVVQAP